jgi:signal transduction histidine kinase
MDRSSWPAQQLAEFIAGVTDAETETTAACTAVERAAEALDADVVAIVCGGELVAAVGYPEDSVPVGQLERVRPGAADSWLDVPDASRCAATAAALEYPPGATLVVARSSALTRPEIGLLEEMARVTAIAMRMLSVLDAEREENERLAGEQAALRRVAMLVASGPAPSAVFAAVAEEVGHIMPAADFTMVGRYDTDRAVEVVGGWSRTGGHVLVGRRSKLGGRNVSTLVFEVSQPARVDYLLPEGDDAVTVAARELGMRSAAGAPIIVEGRLWGVMIVTSKCDNALPRGTEHRLAAFTELVAATIANAQARVEFRTIADEQSALRRVATLVAKGASPAALFEAVAEEACLLLPADAAVLSRYDPDGHMTRVGAWSRSRGRLPKGRRDRPGGRNVRTLVFETGQAARIDDYGDDADSDASGWVIEGLRSAVGVPIIVQGRLWGVVGAASTSAEPLPADTEARLTGFTELLATAIANAQAEAELTASRARVVATADETRRRIERDLHDGAQQQLVSLALQLRAAQQTVPPELGELRASLDRVTAGLTSTLNELREYARGIHPAILTDGGLPPALKTLARRSPVPVTLHLRTDERLPDRVEVTAYYVVSEALANAAKHARASMIEVNVEAASDVLTLTVRDDGIGGADSARGSGLTGLKDRVDAIGGTLSVQSHPGQGTILLAKLPIHPPHLPAD